LAYLGVSGAPTGEFWRGRRVFLTGHTGFKGGWLAVLLERLGAKVTGYALAPPITPTLFETAGIGDLLTSEIGDLRDGARLRAAMAKAQPEIIFHLAAQALVRRARQDPVETFTSNVTGTVELLEAIRATPSVSAAVVVTSDKVYDNVEWPWAYREADRLGGKEPYGASKACCEIVVEAWRHAYLSGPERRVALATARAGNVIGGGDWAEDRLIPDAVRAFGAHAPLVVRNPSAVRPWQHVLEPLVGYCRLAEALAGPAAPDAVALNFGPAAEDARPVREVVEAMVARWGVGAAWTQDPAVQPYEARLLEVDSALARAELGWTPKWRLAEGLDRTVDWYKAWMKGEDMQAFTRAQVEDRLNG
jgi:CDP-glucose 4,6-dehydratase